MRTSASDPLRIDAVEAPGGGRIGLTICPGKKQRDAVSGPWDRDLEADLAVIAGSGAAALVTLMEPDELVGVQVPPDRLGDGVRSLGLEWFNLPIVDVDVPDRSFERSWRYAGARLRYHLHAGRDVVLHCRGGLGRSGTISARLLVELGVEPAEAVVSVRTARPGSIETLAQEAHVLAAGPASARSERIAGCLLAGAIGDALGWPVEFLPLELLREKYGQAGIRDFADLRGEAGQVTDDTQMTLFTGEGLLLGLREIDGGLADLTKAVWLAYRRWLLTQDPHLESVEWIGRLLGVPELHVSRAVGATCVSALRNGRMGRLDAPLNDSKGCGGVMRVAPVGLIADRLGSSEAVFALGAATAATTHGHPSGRLGAGVQAATIAALVEGEPLDRALDAASEILIRHPDHEETSGALRAARALAARGVPSPEEIETLGGGWVAEEALAIAVCAALATDDLEESLRLAVNHGGDSDSTGAIAGNLVGARLGAGAIPARWAQRVEFSDLLLRMAGALEGADDW
jgi:ADP-ribosylglycohydrolase